MCSRCRSSYAKGPVPGAAPTHIHANREIKLFATAQELDPKPLPSSVADLAGCFDVGALQFIDPIRGTAPSVICLRFCKVFVAAFFR